MKICNSEGCYGAPSFAFITKQTKNNGKMSECRKKQYLLSCLQRSRDVVHLLRAWKKKSNAFLDLYHRSEVKPQPQPKNTLPSLNTAFRGCSQQNWGYTFGFTYRYSDIGTVFCST